jgi:hypothetical protein
MENFGSWLPTWDMDISVPFIHSNPYQTAAKF